MVNTIIQIKNVSKSYKTGLFKKEKISALKNISLEIFENEIFGILGENGAGKTTLLNIIIGLLLPDSGEVLIKNQLMNDSIKEKMNISSGFPNYPWCLTVKEMLTFYGKLYNLSGKKLKYNIDKYIDLFDLKKFENIRYDELSTGNKQKLSLAKAFINEPEILLLDEPTLGMDVNISKKIREIIKYLHKNKNITIILTSHYMKDVEELCNRITFLKDGKIYKTGNIDEIKKELNTTSLEEVFLEFTHK